MFNVLLFLNQMFGFAVWQRITYTLKYTNFQLIDYTKILLLNVDLTRLKNLEELTFFREISQETAMCANKKTASYHFCTITIYDSGIVLFSGSIHKMYNSLRNIKAPNYKNDATYKGFNGNQFNLNNIIEIRTHLMLLFDCKPHQMKFQNVEFGVNADTLFTPDSFIRGLLYHNGKQFEYRYNNNYSQSVHQQFIFKIYNKGNQYGMSKNTIRVELKFRKMKEVKQLGIETFADINTKTLDNAKQELLRRFDEVVYYDYTINKKELSKTLKRRISKYSNPRYWLVTLRSNHRDREKKKLKEIITNHSENLHNQVRQDIEKKCVIINRHLKSVNV